MPNIVFTYFCLQTKLEVPPENIDAYISENPSHHLVECIRNADPVEQEVPVVKTLVAAAEQQAISEVVAIISDGSTESIFKDTVFMSFSESSVSSYDWLQVGSCSHTNAAHALPFDTKIVGLSASFSKVSKHGQFLEVFAGFDYNGFLFATSEVKDLDADVIVMKDLDYFIPAGTPVRVRAGWGKGVFNQLTVNIVLEVV